MEYIIEVKRPFNVEPKPFAKALRDHLKILNMVASVQFEIFETASQRHVELTEMASDARIRCLSIDPRNGIGDIRYIDSDIDAENDAFFVRIDVPEEYIDKMNKGKGAFLPRVLRANNTFTWGDEESPAKICRITALDYVKKGGQ